MRSVVTEWFVSTFIKRRWTLLTFAGTFLAPAVQWVFNNVPIFAAHLYAPSAAKWLYVVCFLVCLAIVQALAWGEQHRAVRNLTGKPQMTVEPHASGVCCLVVKNSGDQVATNITALDLVIASKVVGAVWKVKFEMLGSLAPEDGSVGHLNYWIENRGGIRQLDIASMLCESAQQFVNDCPLTLVFSNIGPPKRTWHSHFLLRVDLIDREKNLTVEYVNSGEVPKGHMVCSACVMPPAPWTARPKKLFHGLKRRDRSTPLPSPE